MERSSRSCVVGGTFFSAFGSKTVIFGGEDVDHILPHRVGRLTLLDMAHRRLRAVGVVFPPSFSHGWDGW